MESNDALLDDFEDNSNNQNNSKSQRSSRSKNSNNNSGNTRTDESGRKTRGRGFTQENEKEAEDRYAGKAGEFEALDNDASGPIKSIEGWIIIVTGIHQEATEEDILDKFSDFGEVRNIQMPLDRKTAYLKGYALLEYEKKEQAEKAIREMSNSTINDQQIQVDWAFSKNTKGSKR